MMPAFFHFQHTLNRLFNNCIVILILDKLFLKYEGGEGGGVKLTKPSPGKTTFKKPSFIRVKKQGSFAGVLFGITCKYLHRYQQGGLNKKGYN